MTTSARAQKRALQEHMLEQGLGFADIAAEFARRYGLRPRTAHREARCLTLTEAARLISEFTNRGRPGPAHSLHMTCPHLAEYERWPGSLPGPADRKPTVYVLAALAAFYDTTMAALTDTLDRDHLPPADLLVIDMSPPPPPPPPPPGTLEMTVSVRPRLLPGGARVPAAIPENDQ